MGVFHFLMEFGKIMLAICVDLGGYDSIAKNCGLHYLWLACYDKINKRKGGIM